MTYLDRSGKDIQVHFCLEHNQTNAINDFLNLELTYSTELSNHFKISKSSELKKMYNLKYNLKTVCKFI